MLVLFGGIIVSIRPPLEDVSRLRRIRDPVLSQQPVAEEAEAGPAGSDEQVCSCRQPLAADLGNRMSEVSGCCTYAGG